MLAVLGVADAELILAAADAIAAADGRAALEVSERLVALGRRRQPVRPRPARSPAPAARDPHRRRAADAFTVTAADPERLRARPRRSPTSASGASIDVIAAALAAIREGDEPRMTVELALLRAPARSSIPRGRR